LAVSRRCSSTSDKSDDGRYTTGPSSGSVDDVVKLIEFNDEDGSGVMLNGGGF